MSELSSAAAAFEVVGVVPGVGAEVTLAGGGDVAGDALALGARRQRPGSGLGDHALLQEGLEPAGLRIEQADLDDLVMEQVAGEPADVELEQVDAFGHTHVGEEFRGQGGELPAGLVQGRQLVLLLHAGSDVTGLNQQQHLAAGFGQRSDLDLEVAFPLAAQAGDGRRRRSLRCIPGPQGALEGTVVGPDKLRSASAS